MMDQERRLREPLRWTPAGRVIAVVLAVALVLAVLGLGIYAATGGFEHKEQAGCIDVTFASTTGAATLHTCGANARMLCASPQEHPQIAESLRSACSRAGYPFGASRSRAP
jgi:hypothetical protein